MYLAKPPRASGGTSIAIENGNFDAGKFVYDVSVRRHARPPVRTGREELSKLCRGWEVESKTYS